MHENVKICPECNAEFFPHIVECNSCDVELVTPEEAAEGSETINAMTVPPPAITGEDATLNTLTGELVCLETGSPKKLSELQGVLRERGIETELVKEGAPAGGEGIVGGGGGGSSCNSQCMLLVGTQYRETAAEIIKGYWLKLHPELRNGEENADKGLCPCCGFKTGSAEECPDCGLYLGSTEGGEEGPEKDEEKKDDGCGPGGGAHIC